MTKRNLILPKIGLLRGSMAHLLASILALIVGVALVESAEYEDLAIGLLLSLVYFSGLLAVAGQGSILARGCILLIPTLVAKWWSHVSRGLVSDAFVLSLTLLLLAFVIYHLFLFIVRSPRVNREVLLAGISTYLLLAVLWATAYMLISDLSPSSFTINTGIEPHGKLDFETALYFSFITLGTVGYGDIVPNSAAARTLAFLQAVVGTFYMAILIARLVAQYTAENRIVSEEK
ncbi:MAG: hypothetical protein DCC75_08310 [Proteobacteria bacterium]|nr:MAG: hypothetical protein DCC75_08310 [Pseudomonadota bacterium]